MANNIAVSITADVADLTAKRAIASAELKALQKDLNDLANTARVSGTTPELQASMLAAGDATAKAKAQVALIDKELKTFTGSANAAHTGMAGITREMIVMGREVGRGDFTRMTGSATILAQRMGLLTTSVVATGAAIGALALPFIVLGAGILAGAADAASFRNQLEATNNASGMTSQSLREMSESVAKWANEGIGSARSQLAALTGSGEFTSKTLQLLASDAARMSQLTGENADKWISEYEKMGDGVAKFVAEYERHYGQVTAAQYTYIRQLEDQKGKTDAEYQAAKDLYDYLGTNAPENLSYLEQAWGGFAHFMAGIWNGMKDLGRDPAADELTMLQNDIKSRKLGRDAKDWARDPVLQQEQLRVAVLEQQQVKQQELADAQSKQTQTQKDGVAAAADLADRFEQSKTSGEKLRDTVAKINRELAQAVAATNADTSLTPDQKAANIALYQKQAAGAISQAQHSDAPPKGPKGPGVAAIWEQERQQQVIDSKDFFNDQTADDLAFWEAKKALHVAKGNDLLAVDRHIYDDQKALARQHYQEQMAADDDAIEKDAEDWVAKKKDLEKKKQDILDAGFNAQSVEYRNADKALERAENEHQKELTRIARAGEEERLAAIKANAEADKSIVSANARTQESLIQDNSSFNPLGEAAAARKILALHQQTAQAIMAIDAQMHADDDAALQAAIDREKEGTAAHEQAVQAKARADADYQAKRRVAENQAANQQIADLLRMRQSYVNTLDQFVQAARGGWGSIRTLAENALIHMAERWVVEHLFMTAEQRAQLAAQVAGHTGAEVAKAGATAAGQAAQVGATATGTAAKAKIVGMSNMKEITSHAATAAAGAYNAMAAIPVVGPVLGAIAAAATFAAVEGFGVLASFDKGTNMLPSDMIAQVHAGERIIPAADNRAIIAALNGGGAPTSNRSMTVNNHYAPTINHPQPRDLMGELDSRSGEFFRWLVDAHRNGKLRFA